jgi:hypothetical protein
MITKKLFPVFIVLLAATLACNLPAGVTPAVTAEPQISVTSQVLVGRSGATEADTIRHRRRPSHKCRPQPSPDPTLAVPMVSVSENTIAAGPVSSAIWSSAGGWRAGVLVGKYTAELLDHQ